MVISDTHKNISFAVDFLSKHEEVHSVIHLGDLVSDADDLQSCFPEKKFLKIRGNNDFFRKAPEELIINIYGRKTLICHGHRYGVKTGLKRLSLSAVKKGVQVVLFGHTHIPCDEVVGGVRLINPSSCGFVLIDSGFAVQSLNPQENF